MLTAADLPLFSVIPAALLPTLDLIMQFEGVDFEDDPDDPGGATKCGISLAYARDIRLDVNGDGITTIADIKAMDPMLAKRLIFKKFYLEPGINMLPECAHGSPVSGSMPTSPWLPAPITPSASASPTSRPLGRWSPISRWRPSRAPPAP